MTRRNQSEKQIPSKTAAATHLVINSFATVVVIFVAITGAAVVTAIVTVFAAVVTVFNPVDRSDTGGEYGRDDSEEEGVMDDCIHR